MSDNTVIIAGAGIAGLALACAIRRQAPDIAVTIIERASTLARPRIGESLPGAARILLQNLGILQAFLASQPHERGAAVATWDDDTPAWQDSLHDPNGPGWHIDRSAFEQLFVSRARHLGVHLALGTTIQHIQPPQTTNAPWRIETQRNTYTAHWLIDATGVKAALSQKLQVKQHQHNPLVCAHAFWATDSNNKDHCTRIAADAHGWWYSVCTPQNQRVLAFHCDADAAIRQTLKDPAALLHHARQSTLLAPVIPPNPSIQGVQFRAAGSRWLSALNTPFHLAHPEAHLFPPRFLAVGDALLAFDPIASQGIFHALASTASAARTITGQQSPKAFLQEMSAVKNRYLKHWQLTYQGAAARFDSPFWQRRCRVNEAVC
ncbi:MAG TPA: tryptophan 7-halogenase [Marinagarivorans sp.]